jgi:hypothetical protein
VGTGWQGRATRRVYPHPRPEQPPYFHFTSAQVSGSETSHFGSHQAGEPGDDFRNARKLSAKFHGMTDDTVALNSAIEATSAAGGGTILLPPGTAVISGLVPKSGVRLVGSGQYATTLRCAASPCIAQKPATQVIGFGLTDVQLSPDPEHAGAVAIAMTSFQQCEFGRLLFSGFTVGTVLRIQGVPAHPMTYANGGSNIVFNHFRDWIAYGVGVGLSGKPSSIAIPVAELRRYLFRMGETQEGAMCCCRKTRFPAEEQCPIQSKLSPRLHH